MLQTVKARSHRTKGNAKAKKIKEQSEEIFKKIQTSKKIFTFALVFPQFEVTLKMFRILRESAAFLKLFGRAGGGEIATVYLASPGMPPPQLYAKLYAYTYNLRKGK